MIPLPRSASVRTLFRLPVRSGLLLVLLLAGCSLPRIIVLHDPLTAEEHIRLGGIYESQDKLELARDQFKLAIERNGKSAEAWSRLGDVEYRLKDYPASEGSYEKALALDPKNGDLRNNLAWVFLQQGKKLDKAGELVEEALALNPDHRPYYLDTQGVLLLKQHRPRDAIASLSESVSTIPPDQDAFLAEAYLHLAEAYRASGDGQKAAEAQKRHDELSRPRQ